MWYAWYGVGLGTVHSSVVLVWDSLRYDGVLIKNLPRSMRVVHTFVFEYPVLYAV